VKTQTRHAGCRHAGIPFGTPLGRLERRALRIQLAHFGMRPEERGSLFYALELAGETGELFNGCKKFIRTRHARRRGIHARREIPEEAADALIALMLLRLASGDRGPVAPLRPAAQPPDDPAWLHHCLSRLALDVARFYDRATRRTGPQFDRVRYRRVVEALLAVAARFGFDLESATNEKLSTIVTKVAGGYYD